MRDTIDLDDRLEAHLRRTLAVVAATMDDAPHPSVSARSFASARWRITGIGVAALAGLALTAWNTTGEGAVERIPAEAAIATGTSDDVVWWLIPSAAIGHVTPCGAPMPGVEVVSAPRNQLGLEWDTMGTFYGEPSDAFGDGDCASGKREFEEWLALDDPTRVELGFTRLGDNDDPGSPWIAAVAVHPWVTSVQIFVDGSGPIETPTVALPGEPTGPRYAAIPLPADACIVTITPFHDAASISGAIETRQLCG